MLDILRYSLFSKVSSVFDIALALGTLDNLRCNLFSYESPSSFETDATPGTLESLRCNFISYVSSGGFSMEAT